MNPLLRIFWPILMIAMLFLVLAGGAKLRVLYDPSQLDQYSDRSSPLPTPETDIEYEPTPRNDDFSGPAPKPAPSYQSESPQEPEVVVAPAQIISVPDTSSYPTPYVGKSYKWKVRPSLTYKYRITFHSNQSVTQNFWSLPPGAKVFWAATGNNTLTFYSSTGPTIDITFSSDFEEFTGRHRGRTMTFKGKLDR